MWNLANNFNWSPRPFDWRNCLGPFNLTNSECSRIFRLKRFQLKWRITFNTWWKWVLAKVTGSCQQYTSIQRERKKQNFPLIQSETDKRNHGTWLPAATERHRQSGESCGRMTGSMMPIRASLVVQICRGCSSWPGRAGSPAAWTWTAVPRREGGSAAAPWTLAWVCSMRESSMWGRIFSTNRTKKPLSGGATGYIVTAPIMSPGTILMGVWEVLPLEVKMTPVSMKRGDASLVGSLFTHGSCQTREQTCQACVHRAGFCLSRQHFAS